MCGVFPDVIWYSRYENDTYRDSVWIYDAATWLTHQNISNTWYSNVYLLPYRDKSNILTLQSNTHSINTITKSYIVISGSLIEFHRVYGHGPIARHHPTQSTIFNRNNHRRWRPSPNTNMMRWYEKLKINYILFNFERNWLIPSVVHNCILSIFDCNWSTSVSKVDLSNNPFVMLASSLLSCRWMNSIVETAILCAIQLTRNGKNAFKFKMICNFNNWWESANSVQ